MVYYGLTLGVGNFGENLYLNTFLVGVVEIPCYGVMLFGLNKIGRRCMLAAALLLSGVCCFIMMLLIENKGKNPFVFFAFSFSS